MLIPENAVDASKFRQVPDNQEVFLHDKNTQSLIIDILEMPDCNSVAFSKHPASFHFEVLGSDNEVNPEVLSNGVFETDFVNIPGSSFCSECEVCVSSVSGIQPVKKFNQLAETNLQMHVVVFRLEEFQTDIVLSFNDPDDKGEDDCWDKNLFMEMSKSLRLLDTSLFITQ